MKKLLQRIFKPRVNYQPLIEVRIFKDALLHNLKTFQEKYSKVKFAPVLKSNAYGHGLAEVSSILDNQGLPFFMVDSFYEALVLRRAGIKTKILILGYVRLPEIIGQNLTNVSFGIIDLEILKNIITNLKTTARFHLKIDTGMHRQGILPGQINEAIKLINSNSNFILEGLCSHLADADSENSEFTNKQIEQWNSIVETFKQEFNNIEYFHISNTAGSHYTSKASVNVGRLGIGLYGINMSPFTNLQLKPALKMVSVVSSVKSIEAGEKVGYGISFEAIKPTIVATVPVGYNEGIDRRLSNKGYFKIGNTFCPIVGRVSMNMSSIDVSEISNVKLEDQVMVISANKEDKNSVENLAKLCECIPYEILVRIPQHLRRVVM